jgi:hypothetical protein
MTSTEPTNTTLESDLASTGLCADCLKGFSFTGTPKGKTIQLSKFDTVYVASNEESKGKPAILMLTDVFGFAVWNQFSVMFVCYLWDPAVSQSETYR